MRRTRAVRKRCPTTLLRSTTTLLIALLLGPTGAVTALELELPIRCKIGQDCFIQNYVDHDGGPGFTDYRCGSLGYDGHKGTDFRLVDLPAMRAGVPVLAAAPGVVIGMRDSAPDVSIRDKNRVSVVDREAGNGVRIDHGDGWVSQYSHLQRDSVQVKIGQKVGVGEVLGRVGLSGNTEFPHVHFELSRQKQAVDPFSIHSPTNCGDQVETLWSANAQKQLNYQPSGLLNAGISATAPTQEAIEAGEINVAQVTKESPALYLWAHIFGLRRSDSLSMELRLPNGEVLVRNETIAERNRAVWFSFIGKKRSGAHWPVGEYVGTIRLLHQGKLVISEQRFIAVR